MIDEGSPHAEPYDVPPDPEPTVLTEAAKLHRHLTGVLAQYRRAMIELGWTCLDVNPQAALDRLAEIAGTSERPEQFCGRTDLDRHTPHHWARLPDGSYGDYDDEGRVMVWCPGSASVPPAPRATVAEMLDAEDDRAIAELVRVRDASDTGERLTLTEVFQEGEARER